MGGQGHIPSLTKATQSTSATREEGSWVPQIHGGLEYWPPIRPPHPRYISPEAELLDQALVSRYTDCLLGEPIEHEADTSEQFPSKSCPPGNYSYYPHPRPDRDRLYQFVHSEFKNGAAFANAQVFLVITDTDNVSSLAHWEYTSRLIRERYAG